MAFLTDRTLATGVTLDDLIHIVITGDTSQGNPDGASYKATIGQVLSNVIFPTFSGGSGNCITDLYVSNIHSCSPLNINPLDEGNVYFGSTSAVTIDLTNNRVGIGTTSPTEKLDVSGKTKTINFQMTSGATMGYVLTSIDNNGNASWQSGATVNIYNSDGSLTGNRTVSQGSFDLDFNGDENSRLQTNYTSTINPLDTGSFSSRVDFTDIAHNDYTNGFYFSASLFAGNSTMNVGVLSTNESAGISFNSSNATISHYDGVTTTREVTANISGISINQQYYFPNSDGTNGQVLTTDGLGNTSWQQIPTSSFTGGSVTGETIFTGGISATTISATTIGSSGDCVDDLYVSNIHSCSPLNINPLDEGNVYFGSNSGITIDLANERLGVGTNSPQYPLQVVGTNSEFYYDPTSAGGRFNIFSSTGLPRFDVTIAFNSFSQPATGGGIGMRSWTDTTSPGYGDVGDMFLYAGASTRKLNIINATSGLPSPQDHIRFYAGTSPDLSTAHMFIDGSGSNKGFVGLGTETPSQRLDVSGNTKVRGSYSSVTPGISVGPNADIGFYTETTSIQDNIQLNSGTSASRLRLKNGTTSPNLATSITQYSNYSALEANTSTGSTTAPLYFVNEANGLIIFRTNSTNDTLYLLPSGETLSVFSATSLPVVFATGYFEGENIALRSVGTSAFVNDIRIDATGKLTTNTSDERLKENIKPITNGLNTILQLSGVTYQWKDRNSGGNDERFGFIAQQVESVDSRLSFTNKVDQYKGVHTDSIIPLLVEALKEQQVVIDELKNRISTLENLNN